MARRKKANRRGDYEGSIFETVERGKCVWIAQVSIPQELGPAKRRTLRGKNYEEVKAKLDALKRQVQEGTIADTDLTLSAYLARWLREKVRSLEPTTFEQYQYRAGKLTQHLGKERLDRLTPLKIQTAIGRIADDTGISTANRCLTLARQAYKQAIRWQLVARSPAEAVDALPEKRRELNLWTPEQAARFLDTAQGHRLYAAFYLGYVYRVTAR